MEPYRREIAARCVNSAVKTCDSFALGDWSPGNYFTMAHEGKPALILAVGKAPPELPASLGLFKVQGYLQVGAL